MKRCLILIPAALLLGGCHKAKPSPQRLRLQVSAAGILVGTGWPQLDGSRVQEIVSAMIDSGATDRDVRMDFAADVSCREMAVLLDAVSYAGARTGDGRLGFSIAGHSGDDFLLRFHQEHG